MLKEKFTVLLHHIFPQVALSRFGGWLAESRKPWLKRLLIGYFLWRYDVDLSDVVEPDVNKYASYNDFFIRHLRSEARPIAAGENVLASPVDGFVSQYGKIENNMLLQAKGHRYSLSALLGVDAELENQFSEGDFMTLYLSPTDYHRVHMPIDGVLKKMIYVPGKLFSVNPISVRHVPGLFARNERLVCLFETPRGPMAYIMVGAMVVASIHTVWTGQVTPPHGSEIKTWHYESGEVVLKKGDEVGHFRMGSTVIMVFPKDTVSFDDALALEQHVLMGEALAEFF